MSQERNLLAVDTSSRVLSVAIRAGSQATFESNLEGTPRHSEHLLGAIETGLKQLKLKKQDLDEFAWGLGPGSFTGLRIGFSVLKGLHLGLGKKAFGASSLDLIALGCAKTQGRLAVCVDARRDRIYTAIYEFESGVPKRIFREAVLTLDELTAELDDNVTLVGDAVTRYGDAIRNQCGSVTFLGSEFWMPRAHALARLWEMKSDWLEPLTVQAMIPRYLRRSEAEEKRSPTS